ncbi:MAG TPA: diguanylate cyclase, partial [Polyangiaceae bacterium]
MSVAAAAIFLAEAAIMAAFVWLPKLPLLLEALLGATLLSAICLPVLHSTWVRLLRRVLERHARARRAVDLRALRDPLTQLPNRFSFEESTEREIEQARLGNASLALLVVDVRRFAEINRALGYGNGDQLLCLIADRLRR